MKFKKLEIKNIASLEDAVIEFDKEPLASENLFLIWGETGSGKSTILDAICLALFGKTPRLCSLSQESYSDELLNARSEMVAIGNPLQLVRRNTGEAYAILTFEGNDGNEYKASWIAKRGTQKKLTSKIELDRFLEKYENGKSPVVYKLDKYSIQVVSPDVVGMDLQQFMRTAILAQGEYDKFINGSCDEKCQILEKLTNTERFSLYGKVIYNRYTDEEAKLLHLQTKMGAVKLMTEEEKGALTEEQNDLSEKQKKLDKEINTFRSYITWLENYITFSSNEKDANKKLSDVENERNSENYKAQKATLIQWNETEEARTAYKNMCAADNAVKQETAKLDEYKGRFATLYGGLLDKQLEQTKFERERDELQDMLDEQADLASIFENSGSIVAELRNYASTLKAIQDANSILDKKQNALPSLKPALEGAESDRNSKKKDVDGKQKEIDEQNDLLKNYDERQLKSEKDSLDEVQQTLTDLEKEKVRLGEKEKELKTIDERINELDNLLPQLNSAENDARVAFDNASKELDKASLGADDAIKGIKSRLKEGDLCPVCGAEIITLLKDDYFEKVIQEKLKVKTDADEKYKAVQKEMSDAKAEWNSKNDSKKKLDKEISALKDGIAKTKEKINDVVRPWNIYVDQSDFLDKFNERVINNKNQLDAVDTIRRNIVSLGNEKKRLEDLFSISDNKYVQCKENFNKAQAEVENQKSILATHNGTRVDLESKLTVSLNDKFQWKEIPTAVAEKLMDDSKKYCDIKERLSHLKKVEIPTIVELIKRIQQKIDDVVSKTAWSVDGISPCKVDDLENQWESLSSNVTSTKSAIFTNSRSSDTNRETLDSFYLEKQDYNDAFIKDLINQESEIDAFRKNIEKIDADFLSAKGVHSAALKTLNDHKLKKPADFKVEEYAEENAENLEESAKIQLQQSLDELTEETSKILTRLGGIEGSFNADAENIKQVGALKVDVDNQIQVVSDWKQLCDVFGDSMGKKFRTIVQALVMKQLLSYSNKYLSHITRRYTLDVDYNNLVITCIDNLQGGEKRCVTTLSGGEKFMTSLAIALGLASLSNNKFTPDILFIDEGFGTLSPECLEAVMSTLKMVQSTSGGRHVGMISHVEALKSEIPVHVAITRVKDGLSKLEVEVKQE